MKKTKTSLLYSGLALLLCISMLIGSTFAWFSDSISSGKNIITAGNLELEMYWTDDLNSGKWHNVEENGQNTIFNYDNWEPGYTDVKYIKLVNAGDLALNYVLTLTPQNGVGKLAEVINVYFAEGGIAVDQRSDLKNLKAIGLLNNVLNGGATADGTLLAADQESPLHPSGEVIMTVAMNMITTAGNEYMNEDAGMFTITALATQAVFESDSFGSDYDADAEYPALLNGGSASATVTPVDGKVPAGGVTISGDGISAYLPEGVALADGANKLTLTITPLKNTTSDITVVNDEILIPVDVHIDGIAQDNTVPIIIDLGEVLPKYLNMGNYRLFHVEDGTNHEMTLVADKTALTAHNQFTYDPLTGAVSVAMASFSEVALVADTENPWNGEYSYDWYGNGTATEYTLTKADDLAGFGAIVGGMNGQPQNSFKDKYVKLISDINIGDANGKSDKIFYPIGYYNSTDSYEKVSGGSVTSYVNSFEGTFDGNGHTITGIYQNTWEMFGDYNSGYSGTPNHYKDAMGLFGYVLNGTVKNLTVNNFSSDGEFTPTGVIAAYAVNSTFENIAITKCNPRVYNTGNGGIVGIGGDSSDTAASKLIFKNITIDNTNKISALWGSWDVACGGLMGMFFGPDDVANASRIEMTNCHVAAQIDVNNDVCGNYQYYWYRYSGMMVGTIDYHKTEEGYTVPDTSMITAEDCTVHFGDWNDYYYCELVANSLASYTHDHQFSRLTEISSLDEIKSGDTWTKTGNYLLISGDTKTCYHIVKSGDGTLTRHLHEEAGTETVNGATVLKEDKQIVYLPFNQLFTGYGWGVKNIPIYDDDTPNPFTGVTILDREVADSEVKFAVVKNVPETYRPGTTIKVGNLFEALDGKDIRDVYVSVSPATESDKVSGTYEANEGNWTEGTITFAADCQGVAKIIITDYYYCTPTVIYLSPEQADEKFTANTVGEQNAYTQITLDDLFGVKGGATIGNVTATITDPNGNETTVTGTNSDWETKTIDLTKAGIYIVAIKDDDAYCSVTAVEFTVNAVDKFEKKFDKDFLYRVGNVSAVSLGTIFSDLSPAISPSGVTATVDIVAGNAAGAFTSNAAWTDGKIQFTGTGVVKLTISADGANPLSLNLEVVDAKNITKAESATSNNVVLLNDISGTFTVSNGHTFYGNGFTVKLPTTSVQNIGNGFTGYISIGAAQDDGIANGGNLDNVRIEGPVYPEMYIYRDQAKITDTSDPDYGDGYNMRYFKNSVIVYGGNVNISNCYISGSRTALCLRGGNNVVIENTTLSGGAYANMQICAGSNVTLRDLTTVQTDVTDSYGKGKTAHGLGIAVDSDVVDLYIEGELNQYNWLREKQWNSIVPSSYQSVFPKFFTDNTFSKYWHYLNGGTAPYVNLAFIFACNWDTSKIHDNRAIVDYGTVDATIAGVSGGVYSKVNTIGGNAISDSNLADPGYTSPGFNPIAPSLTFDNTANNDADDANDAADTYCVYDESSGTLKIGVSGDSKTIDLSGVSVTKNGAMLAHTAYLNGTQINGNSVTIKAADGAKQTLTFKATSNDAGYDKDGNPINGTIEYTWTVTVEMAVLAYPAPVWNMGGTYKFDTSNCYYAYYQTSQGYGEAVPIYEGIKVNYYDKSGKLVNLDLSGTTTLPTGSNNANANAFTYTLSDGSTLTMKYSSGWKSGATTHQFTVYNNKAYIYPQSLDNDNYVRAKTTNQNFDVKITYTFTDPNGQSTETVTMNWYNAAASNGSVSTVQWKTFDSTNGKSPSCVTADTLVTLADGSQKRIDQVTYEDQLLVWDFDKGEYAVAGSSIIENHGYNTNEVIKLTFEDGTTIKVVNVHGFFDADLNKWVDIKAENASNFIGHSFTQVDGDSYKTVKLASATVTTEYLEAWSILTADNYNCILEGMFSVTPPATEQLAFFEIGEDMKYDAEAKQADIEKYGLYTYDEFAHLMSYEAFEAFNIAEIKIAVGKGLITYDEVLWLIATYA